MTIVLTILGVLLIAVALRDIFQTLFAPSEGGDFSTRMARLVWLGARFIVSRNARVLSIAGPLSMIVVIFCWATALAIGWAFIYWPHLPDGFLVSPGFDPDSDSGFLDALYLSTVTMTTLGYGDITPLSVWLRLVGPLEAFVGFGLITASISWIVSVHEVLGRRDQLAREIVLLKRSDQWDASDYGKLRADALDGILLTLANQVISVRDDFAKTPVAYYFHTSEWDSALPVTLQEILPLVNWAETHGSPSVQLQASLLRIAIDDLAVYLDDVFLRNGRDDTVSVLEEYATDHLYKAE